MAEGHPNKWLCLDICSWEHPSLGCTGHILKTLPVNGQQWKKKGPWGATTCRIFFSKVIA